MKLKHLLIYYLLIKVIYFSNIRTKQIKPVFGKQTWKYVQNNIELITEFFRFNVVWQIIQSVLVLSSYCYVTILQDS